MLNLRSIWPGVTCIIDDSAQLDANGHVDPASTSIAPPYWDWVQIHQRTNSQLHKDQSQIQNTAALIRDDVENG